MLRPPTHTDPDAIPRNGTDVPWVELPDPRPDHEREESGDGHDVAAAGEATAATVTGPRPAGE